MSSHDPPVILAKIDANDEENEALADEFDIKAFPTLKILRNGGKNIQEYKGPHEADRIVAYMKKQVAPASVEIKSVEDAASLIGENKILIVRIFGFSFSFCFSPWQVHFVPIMCVQFNRLEFFHNSLGRNLITSLPWQKIFVLTISLVALWMQNSFQREDLQWTGQQ